MKLQESQLDVRNFQNVFHYLQEYYALRKEADASFSFEVWAKELGEKSRTYLHAMILGERPLKESLMEPLIRELNLEPNQQEYFRNLFHFSRSKSAEHRKFYADKLLALSKSGKELLEIQQHYEFLSNPLLPRLQTMMSFPDSPQDAATLAFLLACDEKDVEEALLSLQSMGLLELDKQGRWNVAKKSWFVPDNLKQMSHSEFYRNVFQQAEAALDIPAEERRFNSLFFALTPEEFQTLWKDFDEFAVQQLAKHDYETLEQRRLYQLNVNVFPMSKSFAK